MWPHSSRAAVPADRGNFPTFGKFAGEQFGTSDFTRALPSVMQRVYTGPMATAQDAPMATATQTADVRTVGETALLTFDLEPLQGLWSDEQYLRLSAQTNRLVELTNGVSEVLPMPTTKHQRILSRDLVLEEFVQAEEVLRFGVNAHPIPIPERLALGVAVEDAGLRLQRQR